MDAWPLLLLALSGSWLPQALGACVLESDFGFNVNCAFKKSGMIRVRNLGGVKGYVGVGFSLGDELGFPQSLSNTDSAKRRSVPGGRSANLATPLKIPAGKRMDVPPFKPLPPARNVSRPTRLAGVGVVAVPPFHPLPNSIAKVSAPQAFRTSLDAATHHFQVRKDSPVPAVQNAVTMPPVRPVSAAPVATLPPLAADDYQPSPELLDALVKATNLSRETIVAAIHLRRQQMITSTTTTTTTPRATTVEPKKKYALSGVNKVMNAPREYYPMGYDKNYDDNFASRVELPDTSFYCGDQKHFPGLYADEDLGCMVFHVCALTDDGLIMKSFLCPESTLFDQTILKCNWWFYVDCKSSSKLYDSNIPVSKSYQLMKALAFFSNYNKS